MYEDGVYDLAGFVVGAVERQDLLPRLDLIVDGDVIIGLTSSGLHSNGYSLIRAVMKSKGIKVTDPSPFVKGESIAESLLAPTKIYVKQVLPLIKDKLIKSIAHSTELLNVNINLLVTGGGFIENIPRCLPKHLGAIISTDSYPELAVFKWIREVGFVDKSNYMH